MNTNQKSSKKRLWVTISLVTILLAVLISIYLWRTAQLKLVDDSLLSDTPCAAPCWQGIVPGETSRAQAMQILRDSPYVFDDSLEESGTSELGRVVWRWCVPGRRLHPNISWQNDTVQEITLGLTYDLTVDQIVSKFGEPEALSAVSGGVPEFPYWIIDLYYPDKGIQFTAYTEGIDSLLEATTEVGAVFYFAPTTLEARVAHDYSSDNLFSYAMNLMRPWQGYGDLFEVYYESQQDLQFQE